MNYRGAIKKSLILFFPRLAVIQSVCKVYAEHKKRGKQSKMRLSMKVLIGSGATLFIIILFGWVGFPKILSSQIKKQVALKPGNEIRDMYLKTPFPLDFKVYMFNVTNYREVATGDTPVLDEIGPFFFEEWKEKVDVQDNDADDTLTYRMKNTFVFNKEKSLPLTGDEVVTIVHPLLVGISLMVESKSPGLLSLVNGALNEIFKPETPFLTASVYDILFGGIVINCTTDDFKAQTLCTKLKTESEDLEIVSDSIFKFSLFGPKNGTAGKLFKVTRGIKNYRDLGKVIEYDQKDNIDMWTTDECNTFVGTDSTIFPPFLTPEEGLVSFSPEICRSLACNFDSDTLYDGLPVRKYTADLGDMSSDPALRCYCPTNDTCFKQGIMDITKCVDAPIQVSLPHFYDCHSSYQNAVRGLHPNEKEHGIIILFESITGSPVYAKKRLQFNMQLKPMRKVTCLKQVPTALTPLFWVEEGIELNSTFTKQINDQLFRTLKIVKVSKWTIAVGAVIGLAVGAFLHFKQNKGITITPVTSSNGNNNVNEPQKNVISMINTSVQNKDRSNGVNSLSGREFDKY